MPAELPISRDKRDRSLEDELARWATELQVRPGTFKDMDAEDANSIAQSLVDGSVTEEDDELIDYVTDRFMEVREEEPSFDRYPVLHVSRQNLTSVENIGELPEDFLDNFNGVVADYINGFIPGQEITPPEKNHFEMKSEDDDTAGSYSFWRDRSKVLSRSGLRSRGSSAAEVSAHETMHKNNVEAIIDDPDTLRLCASIYRHGTPDEYKDFLDWRSTAPVNENLLGGLGLFYLEQVHQAGILPAYLEGERGSVDFTEYTEEFRDAVTEMEHRYDLNFFDVRDETICQSISYFLEGGFEDGFENRAVNTREHYNSSDKYSEDAGDMIVKNLEDIRKEFRDREGLRGQRFKETMEKRIPFLKGNKTY